MKRFWRKKYFLPLGILALFLIIFGLGRLGIGPFQEKKIEIPKEIPFVEENLVSASGKVEAKNVANLTFQTSGLLAWVGAKEGERVKKWQAIASLDKREIEKELKKKLLAYMKIRWDFEQKHEDYKVGGRPLEQVILTDAEKRILEKAQFDLDSAVLDVEIKDLVKQLATIVSPIEGIVTRVDTPNPGVNVTPLNATFTVVDPRSTYFSAFVDEADIGQVKVGQKAKIILDSYSGEEFAGKVERIDFVSTSTAGGGTAFRAEISLPENKDFKFKVGMNGDVEILLK